MITYTPYEQVNPTALLIIVFLIHAGLYATLMEILGVYLLPTYIALARQLPNTRNIITTNLAWGWTVAGWIRALVLATQPRHATTAEPRAAGTPPTGLSASALRRPGLEE